AVPEHMVVVDLEGKARAEVEGIMGKRFPDTMASATPGRGGGEHLWFTRDPSHPIRNRVKLFGASGPHVDIRTKGGYVIVPPSLHPSGKRYRWANEHRIEKAPDWLIEMCTRS